MTRHRFLAHPIAMALTAACLCVPAFAGSGPKQATADGSGMSAQARYQQDRANCLSGKSQQDQKTCLKEAGAAYAEARRGELGDGGADAATLDANARKRCEPLPTADRLACLARMDGKGIVTGSVQSGGIYRELTVVEPAPAPANKPAESNSNTPSAEEQ